MSIPTTNMWFISISTMGEALDFTNWLSGKRKMFDDSMEFQDWLRLYKQYPFEIYLDGITYSFKDRSSVNMFLIGFEAALNMKLGYD